VDGRAFASRSAGETLTLYPWDYLWIGFSQANFPDLFNPVWVLSLVLLVVLVVLYNLRTRALHRHRLYTDMWEWLLWSGLITFFLLVAGSVFQFDFAVVLVIGIQMLPGSLIEAVEDLESDDVIAAGLGEHLFERFVEAKREEWDAYRMQVTPWELERYLPIV